MNPSDLIETALILAHIDDPGRPRQTNLKRALSTAYYSMFHALCLNCADSLVGTTGANRSQQAWQQAYRSIRHGFAKEQCKRDKISEFPFGIRAFAKNFVVLQDKRHQADYNPSYRLTRNDVYIDIETAAIAIRQLRESNPRHRTAFAVWTAMAREKGPN